jgi:PAS domain S-box-containing protein
VFAFGWIQWGIEGYLKLLNRINMENNLEDLLDLPFLQGLQEKLNSVYAFPSAIIDNNGKVLTAVGRQEICTIFHRSNPESAKQCLGNDKHKSENNYCKEPACRYNCTLGLTELVSPIVINGQHKGIFVTGQFFTEKADIELFKNQSEKYGFEENAYLKAIEKVPVWSAETIALCGDLTKGALDVIIRLGVRKAIEIDINRIRQESEERLKFYTYHSPLAVIEWDSDFKVTLWTGGAEKMFGWKPEEVTGRKIMDLNLVYEPDIPIVEDTIRQLKAKKDDVLISNNRNLRKDRKIINCVWYNTIMHDQSGNMAYILSQVLDVTETVEYEKKLINLNTDKDRFLSVLSHDLRSPIGGVVSLTCLLKDEVIKTGNKTLEDIANVLYASSAETLNLLEETLEWANAKQGNLPFEPITLLFSDICGNIIKTLHATAAAKNITISCSADDNLTLFGDHEMIRTVLRNMVSNAIKFTYKGGNILIKALETEGFITVSVTDNGTGILPENLPLLFDNSQIITTRGTCAEKGTGLGLLLCRAFIEQHGGTIWAESTYGSGSVFSFTLPTKANG